MTATTAVLLPVQKKRVRAAIMNALGRHGVSQQTAESIWTDLTTGNDPRPANLPESFHYRGIALMWPNGRHLRPVRNDEIKSLNAALSSAGVRKSSGKLLDQDDNAAGARAAYTFLWTHKNGTPSTEYGPYNPEPVRAAKLRALVEEATEAREIANAPIIVDAPEPVWDEDVPLLTGHDTCTSTSPKGKACTLVGTHDGQHANGSTRWGKRDRVYVEPVAEPVLATCGAAGPFEGVACEREAHEDDQHNGNGYAWTGVSEPVSVPEPVVEVIACPFERDECLAMQEGGEGACDEHPMPTRLEILSAAMTAGRKSPARAKAKAAKAKAKERTNVQIVTTPERVATAQAVPLEATTDVDALLAELRELSIRLEGK